MLPKLREKDIESIPSILSAKRKGVDGDGDQVMEDSAANAKPAKGKGKGKKGKKTEEAAPPPSKTNDSDAAKPRLDISAMIPFLTAEHLAQPKMPTREEMDTILLDLRKRALLQEYVEA